MSESAAEVFFLKVENARERMAAAWHFAKRFLELGQPAKVTVEEVRNTRSIEQNDKLHAICGELAKKRQWAGQRIDTEGWKRLLVDAWARATNRKQGRVVPSLDGQSVVNLGIQTRNMKVGEMSELIEFAQAWCVENEVRLSQ